MKKSVYIVLVSCLVLVSCKKEILKADDFVETRHALRSYIELATITECVSNYLNQTDTVGFSENGNQAVLNTGPYNKDNRVRIGTMTLNYIANAPNPKDTIEVLFDYWRDSMHVVGNLLYVPLAEPSARAIAGTFNMKYKDGNNTNVNFDLRQVKKSGYYGYTGTVNGSDIYSNSFKSTVVDTIKTSICNNYGTNNDSKTGVNYLQYGKINLNTIKQGEGNLWFGYNGTCDVYCVVIWEAIDLQLNLDMVNY